MRGGPAGRGARGGPGAIDFSEEEPAVESIDWLGTVRWGGASAVNSNGFGWAWPWGQPYTPYATPNLFNAGTFGAWNSAASWAYPGADRIFAWPQILGRTRTISGLAISRRSASASSDNHKVLLGIYSAAGLRLWHTIIYLYPATAGFGTTSQQTDVGSVTFVHDSPALTLTAGTVYYLAMMHDQSLITDNVAINGFHASLLFPWMGVRFEHDLAGATTAGSITPAAPQPSFAIGYAYQSADNPDGKPVPNPYILPEHFPDLHPNAPVLPADPGLQYVLQSRGNGGANVPAIWTAFL